MGILTDLTLRLTANSAELNRGLQTANASVSRFSGNVNSTGRNVTRSFSNMQRQSAGALQSMTGGLSSIAPAAGGAVGGLQSMAVGARALNVALGPIGIILTAVVVAIKALGSYFKGTTDGATKFAEIMGYLKGITTVLQDAFIELGRLIVNAFEDPKQAVADLWAAIKNNLWNRWEGMIKFFQNSFAFLKNGLKALGKAIAGLFNKDKKKEAQAYWDEAKKNLIEMGDAALQVGTGLDKAQRTDIGKKLSEGLERANKIGKASAQIEKEAIQLQLARIEYRKKAAAIEVEIAELVRISSDKEGATNEEREAALIRAKALRGELGNETVMFAEKELELQARRMDLGKNSIEDEEKYAELVEKAAGEQKKVNDQLRELENRQEEVYNSQRANEVKLRKEREASAAAAKRQAEEAKKQALDFQDFIAKGDPVKELAAQQTRALSELQDQISGYQMAYADNDAALTAILTAGEQQRSAIRAQYAEETLATQAEADQAEWDKKVEIAETGAEALSLITDTLGNIFTAQKNKELAAAGDNAKKREEIEKKFAKKQKGISVANAVINGAVAFTKALASAPPPLNFVLAGLTSAATAAQIAVIASQSFADGGIVSGPVNALVGEYPGARSNPEVIAPLSKLKNILDTPGSNDYRFVIEGTELVGVLDNQALKTNAY